MYHWGKNNKNIYFITHSVTKMEQNIVFVWNLLNREKKCIMIDKTNILSFHLLKHSISIIVISWPLSDCQKTYGQCLKMRWILKQNSVEILIWEAASFPNITHFLLKLIYIYLFFTSCMSSRHKKTDHQSIVAMTCMCVQ